MTASGSTRNARAHVGAGGHLVEWRRSPTTTPAADAVGIALTEAISPIEGISMCMVSIDRDDAGAMLVSAGFEGWSPSLHLTAVSLNVSCASEDPAIAMLLLGPAIARQAERAADARRLGLIGQHGYGATIGHLWTDKSLAEMRAGDPTLMTVPDHLAQAIPLSHRDGSPHQGGASIASAQGVVMETMWRGERARMAGASTQIMPAGHIPGMRRPDGPATTFDGVMLSIPSGPLPETVLVAMTGRRVGDLARVHPTLDGRTIGAAMNGSGHVRIVVVPDLVRVAGL